MTEPLTLAQRLREAARPDFNLRFKAADELDRLSAELAEARKREERLQELLVGRDVFIVEHDLWAEFVATLPLSPEAPQPEAKEAPHD